ncbi:MAG: FAD:protein FMN transferase [Lachnospiraceae bacterium]|nr:FAD:protein FMN transferase [Lachnospiraceae bacterium]
MFNFNQETNHNLKTKLLTILVSITFIFILSGCQKYSEPATRSFLGFDTIIEITIFDDIDISSKNLILDSVEELCQKYENLFSRTNEISELYKLNHNGEVIADKELISILKEAIDIAEKSNGLVDPTIGSLVSLWNIGKENFKVPDDSVIKSELKNVNYENIIIDEESNLISLKNKDSKIDLGFIAKGYIADKIKELLIEKGIDSALINLGGNILVLGQKTNNGKSTDFNIGINNPSDKMSPLLVIKASDSIDNHQSVVSSGNYERVSTYNGINYHHILSTYDGYPVGTNKNSHLDNNLSQVTIISKTSIIGDELSTLCFILGYEKSIEFLSHNYNDVLAIFIDNENNIKYYPDKASFSIKD